MQNRLLRVVLVGLTALLALAQPGVSWQNGNSGRSSTMFSSSDAPLHGLPGSTPPGSSSAPGNFAVPAPPGGSSDVKTPPPPTIPQMLESLKEWRRKREEAAKKEVEIAAAIRRAITEQRTTLQVLEVEVDGLVPRLPEIVAPPPASAEKGPPSNPAPIRPVSDFRQMPSPDGNTLPPPPLPGPRVP